MYRRKLPDTSINKTEENAQGRDREVESEGMMTEKWISVEDEMPPDGETVLVIKQCKNNNRWAYALSYYTHSYKGWSNDNTYFPITHWLSFLQFKPETMKKGEPE